jgi:acyl-CoA thioester hydrolase
LVANPDDALLFAARSRRPTQRSRERATFGVSHCRLRPWFGSRERTQARSGQTTLIGPEGHDVNSDRAHQERFVVRWSDLDANRHVRNTIFSELATHSRFRMLESHGFSQEHFERLRFGPVMFREDIRYRREIHFGEEVLVNVLIDGLSPDGSHWKVRQEVLRAENMKQAAVITIDGAWLHLDGRKLVAPPQELLEILGRLRRTSGFAELRSVMKR